MVKPDGASSMPSRMVLLAVGAFWVGFLPIFMLCDANVGGVPSAAYGTLGLRSAGRLVMPKLLTVEASERFRVICFGGVSAPHSQVYFSWDLAYEGT